MKKLTTKFVSILLVIITMVSVFSMSITTTSAVSVKSYTNILLNSTITELVGKIPVIGPLASNTVAEFLCNLLKTKSPKTVTEQLDEIQEQLNTISGDVKKIIDILGNDQNTRGFNSVATSANNLIKEYFNEINTIIETEEKIENAKKQKNEEEAQRLSAELESFKEEKLPAIVDTMCEGNNFYNVVNNLKDYILGNGAGQSEGVMASYYTFCKKSPGTGYYASFQSSKYDEYVLSTYSSAVFSVLSGLFSQKDYEQSSVKKADIDKKINTILKGYKEVWASYNKLTELKESEKYNYYDNGTITKISGVKTITLEKNVPSSKVLSSKLDFKTVKKLISNCPDGVTIRQYLSDSGYDFGDVKYLAAADPKQEGSGAAYSYVYINNYKIDVYALDSTSKNTVTETYYSCVNEYKWIFCTTTERTYPTTVAYFYK